MPATETLEGETMLERQPPPACHPERSEGSYFKAAGISPRQPLVPGEILRCAQGDRLQLFSIPAGFHPILKSPVAGMRLDDEKWEDVI
jgi:hypothetical protein